VTEAPSRRETIGMLESWWEATQTEEIRPEHPLASVQTLHLVAAGDAGPYRLYGKETRPTGRSRPLIRDLPGGVRLMDNLRRDVEKINRSYHRALVSYAELREITLVGQKMKVARQTAYRYVDAGLGMLQMGLLRGSSR